MINEWDLTQTNQKRIMNNKPNVAILGTSAIEAHNYHLPEGQDFLHTDAIVKRVTKESWDKTQSVICLPTLPYGVDCNLMDFPLTIHVKQSTLDLMITEIVSVSGMSKTKRSRYRCTGMSSTKSVMKTLISF